jgi:adenine phosphoribosyltransferase
MNIQDHIRIVPGFPKPGINFYDIATLLAHPGAWKETIRQLKAKISPYKPDVLMGIEARGFLVAAPLALELGCGFGMIRKKGKLPGQTLGYKYTLEYGEDEIEIQPDLLKKGSNVVIVDDLLATGGTMGRR